MKPEKIIKIMTYVLYSMAIFDYIITIFSFNPIVRVVMNKGFSFLFPMFIFISFWYIQLKRRNAKLGLPKFYLYVCLNAILPYIICIIPYMIYDSNGKIIETLIFANNMPQFLCVKTMIELFLIYPAVEYWVKKKANFVIIVLLIISILVKYFSISAYIFTYIFDYIIFAALGISFAENEKMANRFLRKNKLKFRYSYILTSMLICFTYFFKQYSFIDPAITIFYDLSAMFGLCYICYKLKAKYDELRCLGRGAIFDFFTHNPLIVFSSTVMLHPIIIKIFYDIFISLNISNVGTNKIVLIISVIYLIVYKKVLNTYYIKHKREVYLQRERW